MYKRYGDIKYINELNISEVCEMYFMACEGQFEDLIKNKWLLLAVVAETGLIKADQLPNLIDYRKKIFNSAIKQEAIKRDKRSADEIINNVFSKG